MRVNATVRKLGTAGVFVLLIAALWVGLSLLPERSPEERRQIAELLDGGEASEARGRLAEAQAAYRRAHRPGPSGRRPRTARRGRH